MVPALAIKPFGGLYETVIWNSEVAESARKMMESYHQAPAFNTLGGLQDAILKSSGITENCQNPVLEALRGCQEAVMSSSGVAESARKMMESYRQASGFNTLGALQDAIVKNSALVEGIQRISSTLLSAENQRPPLETIAEFARFIGHKGFETDYGAISAAVDDDERDAHEHRLRAVAIECLVVMTIMLLITLMVSFKQFEDVLAAEAILTTVIVGNIGIHRSIQRHRR